MNISKFKSGDFQQDNKKHYSYQYFLPNNINHIFEIDNANLQVQLEKSTRLLGELNAMARMVPNIKLFIMRDLCINMNNHQNTTFHQLGYFIKTCRSPAGTGFNKMTNSAKSVILLIIPIYAKVSMSFIKNEATLSSKIEGTQTDLDDTFKEESNISIEQKDDWLEVNLYIEALENAINKLDDLPISSRLIKQTHKILLSFGRGENKMPGEFRISQNWIGGNSIESAEFVPPHQDFIPALMSDLEQFLHEQNSVPDIIKIAIIHYQFETIHPFLDGNGRVGRILIPLYFAGKGLLLKPLFYMSAFFEANKDSYYQKLMKVRLENNLIDWVLFFLRGVEQTAKHSIEVLIEALDLKKNLTKKIQNKTGNRASNNLKLFEGLFQKPFIQVREAKEMLSVSSATAKHVVDDLVKIEILEELTDNKRNRLFAFRPYLNILNKPFPAERKT